MARISLRFPLSHGVPRVDDRGVASGIVYVICNGLQWMDALKAFGPHKTLYNRFVCWSGLGVLDRIFASLAVQATGNAFGQQVVPDTPCAICPLAAKKAPANGRKQALILYGPLGWRSGEPAIEATA